MTLKTFITDRKTRQIKRGALARVAEHLGVHKSTVVKWINGEWKPNPARATAINEMIREGIDLSPRSSPGRPRISVKPSDMPMSLLIEIARARPGGRQQFEPRKLVAGK